MKNFLTTSIIFLSIFLFLLAPAVSLGQTNPDQGLVPCGKTAGPNTPDSATKPCDFTSFLGLINTVVHFILFDLALPISAIMFAYAGILLVTSGGSTEQMGKAKKIFGNVAFGLVISVAAWLIISTILHILGFDGSWIGF